MSEVAHPFDVFGRSIVESLEGLRWRTAWLRASLPEPGVMNRQQRYVDDGDGVEKDFVLRGAFKVMDAMEAHLAETSAKGFPAWSGLTFRIDASGKFDVEYSYRPS
jgi:hypothetical protein